MIKPLYTLLTSLIAPPGAIYLAVHPRLRPLLRRFSPDTPTLDARPIWVHACSVGEVRAAAPLLDAIASRWNQMPIVITTSTIAGHALAESLLKDFHLAWLPFDHPIVIRRFIRKLKPRLLALIETELWPALLWEAERDRLPVVLLSGRLSDKNYTRYIRHRRFMKNIVTRLSAAGMQNQTYSDRIIALGMPRDQVSITGNTKFEGIQKNPDPAKTQALMAENGFSTGQPIIIFGSTRPGDEQLAATCFKVLLKKFPTLKMIVAPRHPTRSAEAAAVFSEPILRRSHIQEGQRPAGEPVLLLDTVGELPDFYAMAQIAVIGGSFFPGVEGHNPIEPVALGVPTVFGPHMRNFDDSASILVHSGAAVQVNAEDLAETLLQLLTDTEGRTKMAERGLRTIFENQGAVEKSIEIIARLIDPPPTESDR